ncbi:MAG: hypothetical protein EON91_02755 [Brevundimonas sp.]|uniref:hypothetical protein n=1 Tax=Brevundimonas sp. TaxID=1871086 RepID=UPI001225FB76|nr:hypothetical protein [Brevundimonas sp.]RZJ19134.1 MAG: hypothetical protein EON91_02755 [Brevundimonas sp.]
MIGMLSAALAAVIVAIVALAGIVGWGGRVSCAQRIGLCVMAAGLVWAGPARFMGYPPGLGDLLFVAGIVIHLGAVYGPAMWRKVDALDGEADGRVSLRRR